MGNENLQDLFVRQNAPLKIRIFDVHNNFLFGPRLQGSATVSERKAAALTPRDEKLTRALAHHPWGQSISGGHPGDLLMLYLVPPETPSKITATHKRGKIRKLLRSYGSGRYRTSAWGKERSVNPESQFGNLASRSISSDACRSSGKDPIFLIDLIDNIL
jgi:hypothetical protein